MIRIIEYAHKCKILRQIQSNKARFYQRINTMQSLSTVIVSSFLTFIGFSGVDKIELYLSWFVAVDKTKIEFIFNLLIFFLFLLGVLHLVFQFGKKQALSERAISSLSSLINYVDDLIDKSDEGIIVIGSAELDLVRKRYEMLIENIPANTDKEFLDARKDYVKKETKCTPIQSKPADLFDESHQVKIVETLLRNSNQVMEILRTLKNTDERLYLGGGILRNIVWDYLHSLKSPTPIEDVDIIYYDSLNVTKEHDLIIEQKLINHSSNLHWSVKNQARMHEFNNENQYLSFEEAIEKWPETCTAFAVRYSTEDNLELIAPHGYSDLFRLLIAPTPHFVGNEQRIMDRMEQKQWLIKWPKLRLTFNITNRPT